MTTSIKALKLTHDSAPVEIRECLYLSEENCNRLLLTFREVLGITEGLVFSTCNRTEVYYLSDRDLSEELITIILMDRGISDVEGFRSYFRPILDEEESVEELFKVSCGLQSAVLGDLQISGQIKKAYAQANDIGMAQAYVHRLMHTIFHTNKRVHQETPFRDGAASMSYASTELASELVSHQACPRVLVLGLGEMGSDIARNLDPELFGQIDLMNRSRDKAEALANELGFGVKALEELSEIARDYDLIISSVSVDKPLIDATILEPGKALTNFVIDLSMPRSVDAEVESLPHVILYNIDEIKSRCDRVLQIRRESVAQVEAIISEEKDGFLKWRTQLTFSPTIHRLKNLLEQIRKEEIARFLKKATDQERQLVEDVTQSIVRKIIKLPVLHLKEACKRGDESEVIPLLNDLFDLEKQKEDNK